jgi:hypothetical protein
MEVVVKLDADGMLPARYGKFADAGDLYEGHPVVSFPFEVTDIPEGTRTLALIMHDYDSIPVCGFAWIHWIACDIDVAGQSSFSVAEDASRKRLYGMAAGKNSNCSRFLGGSDDPEHVLGYTGPCPPDGTHDYTFTVYALDCALGLAEGFYGNELRHAMRGHVLAKARIELPYPASR